MIEEGFMIEGSMIEGFIVYRQSLSMYMSEGRYGKVY